MNLTDAPKKQPVPFGVNGSREDILSTTPAGDNQASYDVGFPPVTMILKSAGGLPPKGQDMNQILFELSALSRWASTGALNKFDSDFSTAISGYPKTAIIGGDDGTTIYMSTIDGNTNNPNSVSTGWLNLTATYAKLSSPALTGTPTAPTAVTGTNTTQLATTAFIQSAITNLSLGTASQRNVGTGTNQIPDMNSFAFTKSNPLSFSLPGGLILKAGNGSTTTGAANVGFPTAFPTACVAGGVLSAEESTNDYVFGQGSARSAGGMTLAFYRNSVGSAPVANSAALTYSWFAIGY